jgi:hypothetical protein
VLGLVQCATHFAIGFYLNGKVLKEYSTLDIAGSPENVSWSESHYRVFRKILGYRFTDQDSWDFDVEVIDGTKLIFDTRTGIIRQPINKNFQPMR